MILQRNPMKKKKVRQHSFEVAENLSKDRSLMWRRIKTLEMENYFNLKRLLNLVYLEKKCTVLQ